MKKYKANIALITVVSMIAITIVGGLALSISNVNYKLSTIGFVASTNISQQVETCKEEAFRRISRDNNFVGNGSVDFSDGTCTYTVSIHQTNPNYREIVIESSYSDYYQTITLQVDTSVEPIQVL